MVKGKSAIRVSERVAEINTSSISIDNLTESVSLWANKLVGKKAIKKTKVIKRKEK